MFLHFMMHHVMSIFIDLQDLSLSNKTTGFFSLLCDLQKHTCRVLTVKQ